MNTPTPETDAEIVRLESRKYALMGYQASLADFARKLEQERDMARKHDESVCEALEWRTQERDMLRQTLLDAGFTPSEGGKWVDPVKSDARTFFGACPNCEPVMCCSGQECGCRALPVDFKCTDKCGDDCFAKVKHQLTQWQKCAEELASQLETNHKWHITYGEDYDDCELHEQNLNALTTYNNLKELQ